MDNSENPFIVKQQKYQEERDAQGIGHLSGIAGLEIKREVDRRVEASNITEEAEKQRIFLEVEKHYVEAHGFYATYGRHPPNIIDARNKEEDPEQKDVPEDPEAEYQRGYN